MITRGVKTVFV